MSSCEPTRQAFWRRYCQTIRKLLHQKFGYDIVAPIAMMKQNAFSRRVPDLVTEELVAVLSRRSSFEFKQLFDMVHENLRARKAANGGEEMLRLRTYEKLQNLVSRGAVKKTGKKYKGSRAALAQALLPPNGHLPAIAAAKAAAAARSAAADATK